MKSLMKLKFRRHLMPKTFEMNLLKHKKNYALLQN